MVLFKSEIFYPGPFLQIPHSIGIRSLKSIKLLYRKTEIDDTRWEHNTNNVSSFSMLRLSLSLSSLLYEGQAHPALFNLTVINTPHPRGWVATAKTSLS